MPSRAIGKAEMMMLHVLSVRECTEMRWCADDLFPGTVADPFCRCHVGPWGDY